MLAHHGNEKSIKILVEEDGTWKVDDVASMGSDVPWLLSWALAADPYAM